MVNKSISRRGIILVLSSPSGAGKSTTARALCANDPHTVHSISVTTRPMRPGEVEGVDYFFVTKDVFEKRREAGEFLEYAKVFDNYYATPQSFVETQLSQGKDCVFDIDWQGTQQLAQSYRNDLVSIFILPPTLQALEDRLLTRAQDSLETVRLRMSKAESEMSHWPEYDYVIINETVETTIETVQKILETERLRRHRQLGLTSFVKTLIRES